jgi:CRISPR-associated protein Csa1
MYFATAEEQRYVQRGLLPAARRQPVADELRGWNWHQPPLRAIYDRPLGVYEVAGKYCPSGRDVFLRRVQGVRSAPNAGMHAGRLFHRLVAELLTAAKRLVYVHGAECVLHLERLFEQPCPDPRADHLDTSEEARLYADMRVLRAFEARRVAERVESVLAHQPHAQPDALAVLALPVNVEVKLDGRYLGLSEHLSADAIAFPEMLILDLKFGPKEPFHRLTTTGYALVLESLYETPIDVGCVVYVRFSHGRVVIERDYHLIGDELRQMFIEERDEKMRLVAEELDPGLPARCPATCPHLATCHPAEERLRDSPLAPLAANPSHARAIELAASV